MMQAIVFLTLVIGLVTGMRAIHKHAHRFYHFCFFDVIKLKLMPLAYVLITCSTACCLISIVVRIHDLSMEAKIVNITLIHAGEPISTALMFAGFHVFVDRLLSSKECKSESLLNGQ